MERQTKTNGLERLLSVREAAQLLGISEKTLWNHTAPRGTLLSVRIGGRVLYDPADLWAWVQQRKREARKPSPAGSAQSGPLVSD